MKKALVFLIALALVLTGCASREDRHPEWPEAWSRAGDHFAVETPEGYYLFEYNPAFAANGIWYMTWAFGQPGNEHVVLDQDGKTESVFFDAQVYLITREYKDEAEAAANVSSWIQREGQNYEAGELRPLTVAGQAYQVLPLLSAGPDNPYSHGAAAFAVRGELAFSVEVLCGESFDGDAQTILELFLNGIHFGA